jgi:hypothetical protein
MPSADFCSAVRWPLGRLSRLADDTGQISRGKLNRLQCTTAGSTLCALDGYGLCDSLPARPALAPRIRFLFIGSHLCSTLPSDPASRRQPLRFTNPSPPSGWVEDFHLRAIAHARHTKKPLRDKRSELRLRRLLSERIAVSKPNHQTGDSAMAQMTALRRRMIDDMTLRKPLASNPTILCLCGRQVQPVFRPIAGPTRRRRGPCLSDSPGGTWPIVAPPQPGLLRAALLLRRDAQPQGCRRSHRQRQGAQEAADRVEQR